MDTLGPFKGALIIWVSLYVKALFGNITKCVDYAGVLFQVFSITGFTVYLYSEIIICIETVVGHSIHVLSNCFGVLQDVHYKMNSSINSTALYFILYNTIILQLGLHVCMWHEFMF